MFAQAAPVAAGPGVVTLGIPVVLGLLIWYLVKHRGHKWGTAILSFSMGVLLAGSSMGQGLTNAVTTGLNSLLTSLGTILH